MTSPRSTGKVALVTGASSGIGAAFAEALAARGNDLILVARRRDRLAEIADRLRSREGVRVDVLPADLASPTEVLRVQQRLSEEDRLGILVNNAGIGEIRPFSETGPEHIEALIATNISAVTLLAHAALPRLQANSGAMINVASAAAFAAMAGAAVYGATKAYVVHFTRSLREEAGLENVRLQALIPGLTRTNLGGAADKGFFDQFPPDLVMSPEDVAKASLAGLELGELICVPALEQPQDLMRTMTELQAVGVGVSSSRIASRYQPPTGALPDAARAK